MEPWLMVLILVVAVASRPIEVRLWGAGRLSDRTLTLLVLGRFPVLVALYAVFTAGLSVFTLFMIAMALVPPLFLYRWMLGFIREQAIQAATGVDRSGR